MENHGYEPRKRKIIENGDVTLIVEGRSTTITYFFCDIIEE